MKQWKMKQNWAIRLCMRWSRDVRASLASTFPISILNPSKMTMFPGKFKKCSSRFRMWFSAPNFFKETSYFLSPLPEIWNQEWSHSLKREAYIRETPTARNRFFTFDSFGSPPPCPHRTSPALFPTRIMAGDYPPPPWMPIVACHPYWSPCRRDFASLANRWAPQLPLLGGKSCCCDGCLPRLSRPPAFMGIRAMLVHKWYFAGRLTVYPKVAGVTRRENRPAGYCSYGPRCLWSSAV